MPVGDKVSPDGGVPPLIAQVQPVLGQLLAASVALAATVPDVVTTGAGGSEAPWVHARPFRNAIGTVTEHGSVPSSVLVPPPIVPPELAVQGFGL